MVLRTISLSNWIGLLRQGHTAKEIIGNLNAAAIEALADQTGRSKLTSDLGTHIFPRQTQDTLGAVMKADAEKWLPIIKELGIRAE